MAEVSFAVQPGFISTATVQLTALELSGDGFEVRTLAALPATIAVGGIAQSSTMNPGAYPYGQKNSCGISVITFQEAAEALASLYIP